jgi:hypothetical protein
LNLGLYLTYLLYLAPLAVIVTNSFTPNARVYFPCCGFCKDRGHFIGLEVLEPISKGQEIRVDYTKTEKVIANPFCDAATGKHIS